MRRSGPSIGLFTAGLATTILLAAGCGVEIDIGPDEDAGPTVTESYDIDDFDHLVIEDSWTVFVTVGPEPSLEVEVAEDLLDDVEYDQSGDRLTLSMDDPLWFSSHRGTREAHITTPSLDKLDVSGAVTVEVAGLTGEVVDVDVAGAVTVDLGDVDLDGLDIELDGASTIEGDGSVDNLTVKVRGASSVEFASMTIENAEIDVSGASSLDLDGAAAVSGRLDGASSVDVADDASVSLRTSGLSSID